MFKSISVGFCDPETAKNFDTCLILHADRTFNASTFGAGLVSSTRAHTYASVATVLGALSRELHGGANAQEMELFLGMREVGKFDLGWRAVLKRVSG